MTYSICNECFEEGRWSLTNRFKIRVKFVFYTHYSIQQFLLLNFFSITKLSTTLSGWWPRLYLNLFSFLLLSKFLAIKYLIAKFSILMLDLEVIVDMIYLNKTDFHMGLFLLLTFLYGEFLSYTSM